MGQSNAVRVNVSNPKDTTSPSVSISSPANGSTISKNVGIQAAASDNVGVTKMELYVDNVLKQVSASNPVKWSWNAVKAASGSHVIEVKAYDQAGNIGSTSVTVYKK